MLTRAAPNACLFPRIRSRVDACNSFELAHADKPRADAHVSDPHADARVDTHMAHTVGRIEATLTPRMDNPLSCANFPAGLIVH